MLQSTGYPYLNSMSIFMWLTVNFAFIDRGLYIQHDETFLYYAKVVALSLYFINCAIFISILFFYLELICFLLACYDRLLSCWYLLILSYISWMSTRKVRIIVLQLTNCCFQQCSQSVRLKVNANWFKLTHSVWNHNRYLMSTPTDFYKVLFTTYHGNVIILVSTVIGH